MRKRKVQEIILPVALGVVLLALLQSGAVHKLFHIKTLQLPLPLEIARALADNYGKMLPHVVTTMLPAVCGLVLGALLGYGVALLVTALPNAGYGSLFLITIMGSVPIVALAPLMNRWFSVPFWAKLTVITIAASGAMAAGAFRGLNDLPKNALDFMRANAASKTKILIKLRMPNSLPAVFTALKIGVSAAMLATIISEFFASQTSGLGYMIKYTLKVGNQKQIGWAYIVVVAVFSILLYGGICLCERWTLRWHVSQKMAR